MQPRKIPTRFLLEGFSWVLSGEGFFKDRFSWVPSGEGFFGLLYSLSCFLCGDFFLTGEGVSLIVSGLLGVSFLLGCWALFFGVP